MTYTVEANTSDVTMYRGIVRDDSGKEIGRTRPFYNRKNARAAVIALCRDLKQESEGRR